MTTDYFVIHNGPSKYDLMMSLFEDKGLKLEKESSERLLSKSEFLVHGMQKKHKIDPNTYYLQILITKDGDKKIKINEMYFCVYNPFTRQGVIKPAEEFDKIDNFFFGVNVSQGYSFLDLGINLPDLISEKYYDWIDDGIEESIKPTLISSNSDGINSCYLLDFNYEVTPNGVIKEMSKKHMVPGNFIDLLLFDLSYPDRKKHLPIIALGQSIEYNGEICYLGLSYGKESDFHPGRQLCLIPEPELFHKHDYEFLVVS